jgi:hypothetical protein
MFSSRVKWRITSGVMLPVAAIIAMGLSTLPASAAVPGAAKATAKAPAHVTSPVRVPVRAAGPRLKLGQAAFNGGFLFQNGNTGLCIDDSSQFGLRGFGCNAPSYNNGFQSWIIFQDSAGNWQLQNEHTGLCIDDSSQFGLRGFPCNGPSYNNGFQKWIPHGNFPYQLQNANTGLCIDDSSQFGLRGFPCNGPSFSNGFQAWFTGNF